MTDGRGLRGAAHCGAESPTGTHSHRGSQSTGGTQEPSQGDPDGHAEAAPESGPTGEVQGADHGGAGQCATEGLMWRAEREVARCGQRDGASDVRGTGADRRPADETG